MRIFRGIAVIVCAIVLSIFPALPLFSAAETPSADAGAEYLDQATEAKIAATNLHDLETVIRLCERAKNAGLSGENLEFCEQLKAATQMQRGLVLAERLMTEPQLPTDWEIIRHTSRADLEEAVKVIADDPRAFYYIARLNLLPGGDLDRGKVALDLAIEKAGNDDIELKTKAILHKTFLEEDKDKKTQLLRDALEVNPDSIMLLLAAASHFAEVGLGDEARKMLDHAVELEPENPLTLLELLNLQKISFQFEEALPTVTKLELLLPDNANILAEKADILGIMEKYDEAIAVLDAARAKDARNPQVLFIRARIYFFKDDLDKALEDIETLTNEELSDELQVRAALLKIDIHAKKMEYNEALRILDRLISTVPYPVPLEFKKVFVLLEKKSKKRALAFIGQMLERPLETFRGNDYAQLLRMQGDAFLNMGNHHSAIKAYKKAMELMPDDPGLLNNYAWVLATSPIDMFRDGELALELALKATEKTDYKLSYIISTLGAAYAENGDFEKALEYANKAIEIAEKEGEERLEDLKKEVESFKQKKPYREMQEDDSPEEEEEEVEEQEGEEVDTRILAPPAFFGI